jgi:hypothetical protein
MSRFEEMTALENKKLLCKGFPKDKAYYCMLGSAFTEGIKRCI